MLTPARRRGVEILDDPTVDPAVRARSIADVTRSNQWLGGLRAAVLAIREARVGLPTGATLLDVGTGLADIPARACTDASLTTIGMDEASSLLAASRDRVDHVTCANALALPFRDRSIDIVCCSQLLHHFEFADAERVVREMTRVARHAVVVSDLRRSWIAAGGFWLVSFPLAFHRVTRHDGVVSVFRGFTSSELSALVERATGITPVVKRRLGFRLTAHWTPKAA
jgi:ubiquinone/menaquinone biosynthesis C-methylase UbiE